MMIGLVIGTLAYRSAYAAVFDFRYNHIPLPPIAFKTQYSRYETDHQDIKLGSEEPQSAEDDKLVFWSWWKHSGSKIEEKEKEMAWLRSIRSVRVTGRELGSKTKPRMRGCSQDATLLGAQRDM
jgi:diacylglycerol diphosphate phosphatase/phosphatidate phosphatase